MTPSELRNYLKEHHQVTLGDLSIHFQSEPEAVKAAMDTWIKKGMVDATTAETGCSKGCCKCRPEDVTVYRWLEQDK